MEGRNRTDVPGTVGRRHGSAQLIGLMLLAGMVGCVPASEHVVIDSQTLVYETIGRGQQGSVTDTLEAVVESAAEWEHVASGLRPPQPFDEVDFTSSVVAVIAIPATSGGYSIEIESIEKIEDTTTIGYVVSTPGPSCITISALTLPFQAVSVQRMEGEVVFKRRTESYKCSM